MERISDPKDQNPNDDANPNPKVRASTPTSSKKPQSVAREELYIMWKDLVQKQRVHEMIKCLQAEKQKLKILHNIEPDSDFLEFASQQHASKSGENKRPSEHPTMTETKDKEGKSKSTVSATTDRTLQNAPKTTDEANKVTSKDRTPKRRSSDLDRTSSSSKLDTHQAHKHYNAHTKSAAEVLSNKRDLTDQEFEDIVELCEVFRPDSCNN